MAERSADWLRQAEADLRHARNDLEDGFYDWACFSAQQAGEKAVKAVFQKMGAEAWGHAVAGLLGELARWHAIPQPVMNAAKELDKAYIPTRYPNAHPSSAPTDLYIIDEAERMVAHAERVVAFCKGLLQTL